MRDLSEFPTTLTIKRKEIECNFVLSLWKDPLSFGDYNNIKNEIDILTPDGTFYYSIGHQMYLLGVRTFDSMAVHTFLADKPDLKADFDKKGGMTTVNEIMSLVDIDNVESYYDELVKNNIVLNLYDLGFDVEKHLEKIGQMTSSEVYDYFDYQLNQVFVDKVEKLKAVSLTEGYDESIEAWDKGIMRGFPVGFPILNYRLAGVHKKNLLLHMAHIGNGKTTSSILFYILPAIENGENVCIIANEQGLEEFRQMILSTVLFNKIRYTKINRQRFIVGGFSEDDKAEMKKAQEWLKNAGGKIIFIETNDYSIGNVKKIVRKYSKVGYGLFVFDTLKPETENSQKSWADFSEQAKSLFSVAKREDVAIIATAQLSGESMARRYLDLSCVGKSKAIAETATQVVMFRTMSNDEKEKIEVYRYHRDVNSGKYTSMREIVDIDPQKDYIILFTPKNRFGDTTPQIVYERNMAWNSLREIGYTHVAYDGFGLKR